MADLIVDRITKEYPTRAEPLQVLRNVSFDLSTGQSMVVLGPSGSGKSTLLKHMIGLYKPAAGKILIEGDDIATAEGDDRLRILQKIGVMYQAGALFGSMTLIENICLPLEEFTDLPLEAMNLIALMKLKLVGLNAFANLMPAELSGGMKKRAAIARAMVLKPKFVVLDEPTSALDLSVQAQIVELLRALQRRHKLTYLFISHDLKVVRALANRVLVMRDGKVVEAGLAEQIFEHPENDYTRALMAAAFDLEATETGAVSM